MPRWLQCETNNFLRPEFPLGDRSALPEKTTPVNHASLHQQLDKARILLVLLSISVLSPTALFAADLRLLFLGDNGPHQPERRFQDLAPALKTRGIELAFTDRMEDLNRATLNQYDGLVLYANIDRIEDERAEALLDYVASGKGFVPLHCATYCWRNNAKMVALMGAQFKRHGGRVFTTQVAAADHPIMDGYGSFTSWDETYVHHLHNEKNRTVLEYRAGDEQAAGQHREPWTWVRTHGEGRVFYTAWGHDQRTFGNAGFHNLVERGIRWACKDDPSKVPSFVDFNRFDTPQMTSLADDLQALEYVDVGPKIPNYTPGTDWGKQAAPLNTMQKPLTPEESIKHFVTPSGMAVRKYADEHNFQAKPIAMTWDERGRLWVCETVDYPNELGGNRDRIRICEDTDGDHVADKFTVFAEGLSIPTAIVIFRGGAIVQNGTETIYLKDTNGDDVADLNQKLITGWTLGDTHGGVSNFRYGLDNWIWAMQGYNNSSPKIDGEDTQTFRQGFWRFKLSQSDTPKVTELEFIRSSNNNTWGLGISEEGLIFGSTANHNPSMFVPIPNRYYEQVSGWAPATLPSIADDHLFDPITKNVRQVDHFGGYTAGAGHALYTARAFPQQWWNKTAFVCGPTGHLVGTFVLRREGANYTSSSPANLLASDDQWSAPIMAEVGPDGAVWVIDWYNYIVQHNPTPNGFKTGKGRAYESDLRDKKHGRVYRVIATDGEKDALHEYSNLGDATNVELVAQLKHPSFVWRLHAQRLLVERDAKGIVGSLIALIDDPAVDAIGLNVGAIHALHTLNGLQLLQAGGDKETTQQLKRCVTGALDHQSAGVRRSALAVLPKTQFGGELLLSHLPSFSDTDAQVRLQALLSLADMPPLQQAGSLITELASGETDPVLVDALTSAAAAHAMPYLAAVTASAERSTSGANLAIARRVAEHISRGKLGSNTLQELITSLAKAPAPLAVAILDGLAAGLPRDTHVTVSEDLESAFTRTFELVNGNVKVKLLRIAAQCGTTALESKSAEIVNALVNAIGDTGMDDDQRAAAARDLVSFRSADSRIVKKIVQQLSPQTSPALTTRLLSAVQLSTADATGKVVIESLFALTPKTKSAAISILLGKPTWAKALIQGIESGTLDLSELTLEQKQALRSFPDPELRKQADQLLVAGGGLPDADRQKVLDSLLHVTTIQGDPDSGRDVFKKACGTCHQHGKLGVKIGPDLTGMAVHPKAELLTHIIDPSRNVEGNYRLYNVLTVDGNVVSGMLASETRTTISIVDSQAKKIDLPREDIEQLNASRKSVMPEGFEKQISEAQLADLLEFLTQKGQYIPVGLEGYATAISTKGLFSSGDGGPDRMVFSDWKPKVFQGIPFVLTDPVGKSKPNIIVLNGPFGPLPPKMPKSVLLPCNTVAKTIHFLSGVGGWSHPFDRKKTVSMIVRLHYADGEIEEHPLRNGVHFADYIRRVDVPKSEFAFALGNQQIRYLAVTPKRGAKIETVELAKGEDRTAPIVMAVTIERR